MNRFRVETRRTKWGWEAAVLLDDCVCMRTGHQPTAHAAERMAREWLHNLIADIQESPQVVREVHL